MKKKVLVFPCGSEIGLELHRSLCDSIHFELIGGSSVDDHGRYVYKNYIGNLPSVNDTSFIEAINELVEKQHVDYIYPAHDSVVLSLANAKAEGKLICEVITSPLETCQIARSKQKTYEKLKQVIKVPQMYASPNEVKRYPVFMKPDVGQGSKGTHLAKSKSEAVFFKSLDPTLLILEYLPGKEYTIDCFTDNAGNLLYSSGRVRQRISSGISVSSKFTENSDFKLIAEKINRTLDFKGAWFFQLKENDEGKLVLLEIAPRIAGTMGLSRCQGVNLPLLSLFNQENIPIVITANDYKIQIDRALSNSYRISVEYEHVYIDLDDLILKDGEAVNLSVVTFLYQCINKNISLHLITRHSKDVGETLIKHRLSELFDEIIVVPMNEAKSKYLSLNPSIFIDDSFAERLEVKEKLGIPVFDSHMVEALMEV